VCKERVIKSGGISRSTTINKREGQEVGGR
jgi:hypothetical protein